MCACSWRYSAVLFYDLYCVSVICWTFIRNSNQWHHHSHLTTTSWELLLWGFTLTSYSQPLRRFTWQCDILWLHRHYWEPDSCFFPKILYFKLIGLSSSFPLAESYANHCENGKVWPNVSWFCFLFDWATRTYAYELKERSFFNIVINAKLCYNHWCYQFVHLFFLFVFYLNVSIKPVDGCLPGLGQKIELRMRTCLVACLLTNVSNASVPSAI